MDKKMLVLAALSAAKGAPYTPVQVQKLMFLIDRNVSAHINGPYFNFQPYDYGPFDQSVYRELEALAGSNHVLINDEPGRRLRTYSLTAEGQMIGEEQLRLLDEKVSTYINELSQFVRRLSFAQLVSAVYKAFPEMKVNSVFRE